MNHPNLHQALTKLRLSGLASSLDVRLQEAIGNNLAHEEFLELILQDELNIREQRTIERRTKSATFRDKRTLDSFDFSFNKSINRQQIYQLASGLFTEKAEDILLIGPPGVGKSHIAQAIGYELIKQGKVVLYRSIFDILDDLKEDGIDATHDRTMKRYTKCDLLIIDDMGIKQLPPKSGEYLFEIIMRRYEIKSTLMTSNRPLEEWGKLITKELGVEPITINSSLIVPQNRNRNYWTNIEYTPITPRYSTNVTTLGIRGATPVVQRKELTLDSIIPGAVSGAGSRGVPQKNWVKTKDNPCLHKQKQTVRKDGLANCLTASAGECCRKYLDTNGDIQVITVEQAEQLQTVPVDYTDVPGVSVPQRFKMLGNGWTVEVIAHIFSCLKKEIERETTVHGYFR